MAILSNLIKKYSSKKAINECVYRLSYAGKYIIVKGKTLTGSLFLIQKGFGWFREDIAKQDTLYLHFYRHIKNNPKGRFRCRVLLKSKNQYNLLKREQKELDKSRYDSNCLNNNVESYLPKLDIFTGDYGWISKIAALNYQKYLKSKKRVDFQQKYSK